MEKIPQFMNIEVKCYYMNTGKDFVTRPKKNYKKGNHRNCSILYIILN